MQTAKKQPLKLPSFLEPVLYSYDISKLDPNEPNTKKTIITQVLNIGGTQAVKWLLSTYTKADMVEAIKNPQRGVWFKESLNFWQLKYNVKLEKEKKEEAIFNLYPV